MTPPPRATALLADIFFHPANLAGANRLNALASAIAAHGRLHVFAVDEGHAPTASPFDASVTTHYLARPRQRKDRLIARLFVELRTARRLVRMATATGETWDTVVVTVPPLMQLIVAAAARRRFGGARYVLDVRDLIWEYFDYRPGLAFRVANRLFRFAARWAVRRFDAAVCATPSQAARLREMGARQVEVVENGIDGWRLDALDALPRPVHDGAELVVAYIGTLGFPQGLGTLIAAAERLAKAGERGIRILIAGTGAESAPLRARVHELGLDNVEFLGELTWRECLERVYTPAHVLYAQLRGSPAYATAIPTKLLEYLASGRPVVYGGHGDAAALLRAFPGARVVPPDDPAALADALRDLRRDGIAHYPEHAVRLVTYYRRDDLSRRYAELLRRAAGPD